MESGIIRDLFNQKKYDEVIEMFQALYCGLFLDMLDKKECKIEEEYNNDTSYSTLNGLVTKYYPNFYENISSINVSLTEPSYTYLEIINTLLSSYMYIKNNYLKYVSVLPEDTESYLPDETEDFED